MNDVSVVGVYRADARKADRGRSSEQVTELLRYVRAWVQYAKLEQLHATHGLPPLSAPLDYPRYTIDSDYR
jgi:hypothetical protein